MNWKLLCPIGFFVLSQSLLVGISYGDLVRITGDVRNGTGTLIFDNDIDFTITSAGSFQFVVFDEWTTSDGDLDVVDLLGGSIFAFSINGVDSTDSALLFDNLANTVSDITPDDGYVLTNFSHTVDVGDTVTVKAGIYSLGANPNFNPALADFSFNGQAFLADSNGNRISTDGSGSKCPGDLDHDGDVDFADLLAMLADWGPCPPEGECPEDIDASGAVGFEDLLIVLSSWGICP